MKLKVILFLTTLCIPLSAGADQAGQLPLRIITEEIEQAPLYGPDAPEFRSVYYNPAALEAAIKAQERHTDALIQEAGASATAVGLDANGEPVIKVYTDRDTEISQIPSYLDGINVTLEYSGTFYALNMSCDNRQGSTCVGSSPGVPVLSASADPEPGSRERHPRPVPIGVSVGHVAASGGTIACRTTDGCHTYLLSNAHVVAQTNSGQIADHVVQPGPSDGGTSPADFIGVLAYSVPIIMSDTASNKVDAAIVTTASALVGTATPSTGYGQPKTRPTPPAIGLNVMKFGRTTEMTYGYIDAINATVLVTYGNQTARFIGQIFIKTDSGDFSSGGDSGSLVVASGGNRERRPVGLVFASGSGLTAANPIADVLGAVGTAIQGE